MKEFVFEGLGIFGGTEIPAKFFSGDAQAMGNAVNELARVYFVSGDRNTRFTEVFGNNNIGRQLAPVLWDFYIFHFKNNRTIGIRNNRGAFIILNLIQGVHAGARESP